MIYAGLHEQSVCIVTTAEFNARYPRRLLLLADRAVELVVDGVPRTFERGVKGRNLNLRAIYQTSDVHRPPEAVRVVLLPHQSERSLSRILLAAFTHDEAMKVRKAWSEPLYPDYGRT